MYFRHAAEIWRDFPELVPGVLVATGITADVSVDRPIDRYTAIAAERLEGSTESELPEISAWRRTFARMGLKPTQYRCASEALLRRFRKEGSLPRIHPLIDVCNAISLAFAIPVAAIDTSRVTDGIEVRYAVGDERYDTFSGDVESPPIGEVVFADAAGRAHARRWTNRQSGHSAVSDSTSSVLIVAEAMHETAAADMDRLIAALDEELRSIWTTSSRSALLTHAAPQFDF